MKKIDELLSCFPKDASFEIVRILYSRGCFVPSEIRIRLFGKSSILLRGERIFLYKRFSVKELVSITEALLSGALYAHRDTLIDGFISLKDGVRVGICGHARYDGGRIVGITDVSSIVFRIPSETVGAGVYSELFSAFSVSRLGMLVYSRVGVGKTTALRSLVRMISEGICVLNTVVVDERCEFIQSDYKNCSVDIMRGYKKAKGMEIALRTLSPDVIVLDEIGNGEEVELMMESLNSGVRILASAHASSLEELFSRRVLRPFFDGGVFDVFAGIDLKGGQRVINFDFIDEVKREDGYLMPIKRA